MAIKLQESAQGNSIRMPSAQSGQQTASDNQTGDTGFHRSVLPHWFGWLALWKISEVS